MPDAAKTVCDSLIQSLRSIGGEVAFALVTAGETPDETAVPRAHVIYQGRDSFAPDDSPDGRWLRLRYRVRIHSRADRDAEALGRVGELTAAAVAALGTDPHRGGVCADLPVGRATETGPVDVLTHLRRPEVGVAFEVRCHLEES